MEKGEEQRRTTVRPTGDNSGGIRTDNALETWQEESFLCLERTTAKDQCLGCAERHFKVNVLRAEDRFNF